MFSMMSNVPGFGPRTKLYIRCQTAAGTPQLMAPAIGRPRSLTVDAAFADDRLSHLSGMLSLVVINARDCHKLAYSCVRQQVFKRGGGKHFPFKLG